MAVFASTADPTALSRRLERKARAGELRAWSVAAGHLREGEEQILFRIIVLESSVKFVLVRSRKDIGIDALTYARHHGRLTELLIAAFSDVISRIHATPYSP